MKTLRHLALILLLCSLTSCATLAKRCWGGGNGRDTIDLGFTDPEFAKTMSCTIISYSTSIRWDMNINLVDSMVSLRDGMWTIRVDYRTQELLAPCEARAYLVDVVEGLLQQVNDHDILMSYNWGQPYTADNLEIYIRCESFYGQYVDPLYVGLITLRDGISVFTAHDALNPCNDCIHERSEYYWQSLHFVNCDRAAEDLYRPIPPRKSPSSLLKRTFNPPPRTHIWSEEPPEAKKGLKHLVPKGDVEVYIPDSVAPEYVPEKDVIPNTKE